MIAKTIRILVCVGVLAGLGSCTENDSRSARPNFPLTWDSPSTEWDRNNWG